MISMNKRDMALAVSEKSLVLEPVELVKSMNVLHHVVKRVFDGEMQQ